MNASKKDMKPDWIDPDDAPELTDEWFDKADLYHGEKIVRRGRPPSEAPKEVVTIRLDADLVAKLRASGKGWQTRVNDTLRKAEGMR
jgi:uncharacterized protein (DUF4415 family)